MHPDYKQCFTYRTWEGLYANCIAGDLRLAELDEYFRGKSAHYGRRVYELGTSSEKSNVKTLAEHSTHYENGFGVKSLSTLPSFFRVQ